MLKRTDSPDVVVLTGSGLALWDLLEAPQPLEDLVSRLCDHYGVASDVLLQDVTDALADLERRGLLIRVPS